MSGLENCTPEYARELLQNHESELRRIRLAMERCKRLIDEGKDYSFLHGLGYSVDNAESFQEAYSLLLIEAFLLEALLAPFMHFLRIVPTSALYNKEAPIYSRIITESELFHLLLDLGTNDQETYLQRLVNSAGALEMLRRALHEQNEALFLSTLRNHQIDTTGLGQFLNTVREMEQKPSTYSDLVNAASALRDATKVSFTLPAQPPFFMDKGHYLTKQNCITSFVSAWQAVESLFMMFSSEMYGMYRLSLEDKLPYQLNYALSVFFKEESFQHLLTILKVSGFIDSFTEISAPDFSSEDVSNAPRPLVKPPKVFSEKEYGEEKCRSFFKKMVRCKKHWFREEDLECFVYLMNVTNCRPQFLRRVIWFGDKYELKCLMEVLYPNRKKKEKPDYGEMDLVFCDKNGRSFNLKNTPLQCRMNHITSPEQAAKEERIMKSFARFAGLK